MELSDKLFVQLAPTSASLIELERITANLNDKNALIVPTNELHVTVIHIGKLERTYRALHRYTDITKLDFLENASKLLSDLENVTKLYRRAAFLLSTSVASRFGKHHSVPVLTLQSTDDLKELHTKSLGVLKQFLATCGVKNVDEFMRRDQNLVNALTLRPHISLAKNYHADMPQIDQRLLEFTLMKLHYDH